MASVFKPSGAAVFYGKVRLGPYRHCRIKLNADRDTSAAWLRELQNAVNRRRARETPDWERIKAHGVPRELMERLGLVLAIAKARGKGWSEHVADYCNELTRAGRNAVYVGNARRYLSAIGKAAGWAELDDVNRDGLAAFINAKREKGRSVTTLCNIRNVVRLFLVWCVRVERADPGIIKAANIDLADPATDRKRVRRALTDAECHRLLKAVAGTPRELTYRLALATGLRRREMTELQWRDVVLDGTPRLCLRPEATKARRADTLPLAPDVAARLAEHGRRRPFARPADAVLSDVPNDAAWKADLKLAKVSYTDAEGRIAGFHSLRVTLGTQLERLGVGVKARMELMRHADAKVTYSTYADATQLETARIVADLPTFNEPAAAALTGTDDEPNADQPDQKLDQMPGNSGTQQATRGKMPSAAVQPGRAGPKRGNPCNSRGLRRPALHDVARKGTAAERSRTSTNLRSLEPESSAGPTPNACGISTYDAAAGVADQKPDQKHAPTPPTDEYAAYHADDDSDKLIERIRELDSGLAELAEAWFAAGEDTRRWMLVVLSTTRK